MERTSIVRVKNKFQIVLPANIRKRIPLKIDDLLEVSAEKNGILLKPLKTIPDDQAWFWNERWQKMEKEVQSDLNAGKTEEFENIDDFIRSLKK